MKQVKAHIGVSIPTIVGAGFVSLLIAVSPYLIMFLVFVFHPGAMFARQNVAGPSGISLEALDRSYVFIGNREEVLLYARRPGEVRKTLLFGYNPQADVALPEITFPDKKTIRIAVPWIQEVLIQQKRWNGYGVQYQIGKIGDPN